MEVDSTRYDCVQHQSDIRAACFWLSKFHKNLTTSPCIVERPTLCRRYLTMECTWFLCIHRCMYRLSVDLSHFQLHFHGDSASVLSNLVFNTFLQQYIFRVPYRNGSFRSPALTTFHFSTLVLVSRTLQRIQTSPLRN